MGLFGKLAKQNSSGNEYVNMNADELAVLCDKLLRNGSAADARLATTELVTKKPDDGYGWQMKAQAFSSGPNPDWEMAYDAISQALQHADSLFAYGMFLADQIGFIYQLGDYGSAVEGGRKWLESYKEKNFDDNGLVMLVYALALRRLGRTNEALNCISEYELAGGRPSEDLLLLKDELENGVLLGNSQFI